MLVPFVCFEDECFKLHVFSALFCKKICNLLLFLVSHLILKAALDELALCNLSIMIVIELGEDLLSTINRDVEVKPLGKVEHDIKQYIIIYYLGKAEYDMLYIKLYDTSAR